MDTPIIFSTERYAYLGDALGHERRFERGVVETRRFPDGERYTRIVTSVHGRDAVAVGGTVADDDTLELYDLACGIVQCGARTITLAVPYFGYSTMERATRPGEVVTAKTRARLLSTVPAAYHANQVLLLDLHTEGIAHYFEGDVRAVHLTARALVGAAARRLAGDDFVVGSTDAGRAKMVQEIANDLGVPASFIFKHRLSGDRTQVEAISAHVTGRTVVIYDDMIRTGGSLVGAARAYLDAGATRLFAVATHGVLPGDSLDRIRGAGLFERVLCTDSHPRAVELAGDFLEVVSVAPVFADHIKRG
jgi:ribose-phosphate pyrophosphokinase